MNPPVTDVVGRAGIRVERAVAEPRERFFTVPRAAAVALFLVFALTFDEAHVHDDSSIYYAFLRKVFGHDTPAVAYQIGSDFWNTPFYLASQLVALRGHFGSFHAGEISMSVASTVAVVVTLYLGWRILCELDLPRGPAVLLLTLFGTPLFYYGAMNTTIKHAADTLYATTLFWLVLRVTDGGGRRRTFVAAGICLALLLTTRYANFAYWFGLLAVLVVRGRRREAAWIFATACLVSVLLFGVAVVRHIPYASPPPGLISAPAGDPSWLYPGVNRLALGIPNIIHPVSRNVRFDPTVPAKMLFTLRRGLFVWTPATAFATFGFVLLLRRDRRRRTFLVALAACAASLLLIHMAWGGDWTGGNSFSARFLTSLFPFFLLGTAEFLRRTRRFGVVLLTFCACWSVCLGIVLFEGYANENGGDSVSVILGTFGSVLGPRVSIFHPQDNLESRFLSTCDRVENRWRLYWRIVE